MENRRKSRANKKAKEALIPEKHSGGPQCPRESPANFKVATRHIPRSAANQPASIKAKGKGDAEIPTFQYKQRPDPNEEMSEDVESVKEDSDDHDEESDWR